METNNWECFDKIIEGLTMIDSIEAFFIHAEELGFTEEVLVEGADYIAEKGMPLISLLIALEILLEVTTEINDPEMNELNKAIENFVKTKELTKKLDPDTKKQTLECLEDLKEAYPEVFKILDENSGNA